MLKNIRLHLDADEALQSALDEKLAKHILDTQYINLNAFQRNIPSLLPLIREANLSTHSVFCNKYGEANIVDYGVGRTLYGFHPDQEVSRQVERFNQHCLLCSFGNQDVQANETTNNLSDLDFTQLQAYQRRENQKPAPKTIECLVILGCGMGLHLLKLLGKYQIKNLIVYEPQLQYFQCSVIAINWLDIFNQAKKNGTALFLQIGKDGRNLLEDIEELRQHIAIESFSVYKHYNHPVFDSIYRNLNSRSWKELKKNGFNIKMDVGYLEYQTAWTPDISLDTLSSLQRDDITFKKNILAFEKYFPNIAKQYRDYQPLNWYPAKNNNGEINLVKSDLLTTWYGESPKQDCDTNFSNFHSQPNKDGLVLGYTGTKLAHYEHYKFVKATEQILKEAEDETGELPETVASIIMFGMGVGYQLERLLDQHKVEKLFLCEPNPDFFYASLFAIDWEGIFTNIDQSKARIYLNIGDDGSHLFRDLLNQFHSIGPYILNNTYFYQSYYNSSLNTAIAQLREQLQVVISMGEYFDHAYYGIEHTKEGLRRQYPLLVKHPSKKLSYDNKEVPVFIVGNGPSLDSTIDSLKECSENAIVVSCGTALQALHRQNIVPDFHAEIEQNRCTFDWPVLINDLDYLKKITLISCNGIHPDTGELYKDVLVAFKEGESSTVSALNILDPSKYESLQHSFPTVSNFVCDLFCVLGFKNIYLMGVDLGFIDVKHHHSKSSAYYDKEGQEIYDYTERNNTSLVVPGNFRPTVNTKHEFKVSRQIIEQVVAKRDKSQSFYNCSDGAKIQGTIPLKTDELLILSDSTAKQNALSALKDGAFSDQNLSNYMDDFNRKYNDKRLFKELDILCKLADKEVSSDQQLDKLINSQKELLFHSYKDGRSLLFYYLYGTINYANALLTKLRSSDNERQNQFEKSNQLLSHWRDALHSIKSYLLPENLHFDCSEFSKNDRENFVLSQHLKEKSILIVTNSDGFANSCKWVCDTQLDFFKQVSICCTENINQHEIFDYVIYCSHYSTVQSHQYTANSCPVFGRINTLLIIYEHTEIDSSIEPKISKMLVGTELLNEPQIFLNDVILAGIALRACCNIQANDVVVPRFNTTDDCTIEFDKSYATNKYFGAASSAIVFTYYSILISSKPSQSQYLSNSRTRGALVTNLQEQDIYVYRRLPQDLIDEATERFSKSIKNLFCFKLYEG